MKKEKEKENLSSLSTKEKKIRSQCKNRKGSVVVCVMDTVQNGTDSVYTEWSVVLFVNDDGEGIRGTSCGWCLRCVPYCADL